MTGKVRSFEEDLEWGEQKQEEALEIFKTDLSEIITLTESHKVIEGKHKFDVKIENPKVEIKSSRKMDLPGRIPIESVNVGDENAHENGYFEEIYTKGWIFNMDCDWILFYYPRVTSTPLRYCNFGELQILYSEVEGGYETIPNKPTVRNGSKWCSGFKLIPWRLIKDNCFNSGTIYNPPSNQTCLTDFVLPSSNWRLKNGSS